MVGVLYVGSHKIEGVCCCQERKEFVLLGLIIQDLGFWFPRAKHRRVSMSVVANCCRNPVYPYSRYVLCPCQARFSKITQQKPLGRGGHSKKERLCTPQDRECFETIPSAKANINHSPSSSQYLRIFPQHFRLLWLCLHSPWLQLRLVSDGAVANGDGAGPGQRTSRVTHDERTDEHHGPIGQLVTDWFHIGAIWFNLTEVKRVKENTSCGFVKFPPFYTFTL